tara:strand:+ start:422547 stop:424730 length:2184 start_codon:yes stop_codon:yes gene_type:complete
MVDQKQLPPYIVMAFEALSRHKEHIKPDEQGRLKKILPVYAAIRHRAGQALSAEIFDTAIAKGCAYIEDYNKTYRTKPPQETALSYQDIVKQFPKPQNLLDKEFIAAIKSADFDAAQDVFKQGANPGALNNEALTYAIASQQLGTLEFLLGLGVDLGAIDCLSLCASKKDYDMKVVKLLVKHGADPKLNDNEALFTAKRLKDYRLVKYLLKHGADAKARNSNALTDADFKTARLLIKNGADPSVKGNNALKRAVLGSDDLALVELLLKHGADPNEEFYNLFETDPKRSVLSELIKRMCEEEMDRMQGGIMLKFLLKHGADPLVNDGEALKRAIYGVLIDEAELMLTYCDDGALLSEPVSAAVQRMREWQGVDLELLKKYPRLIDFRPYIFDLTSFETTYKILREHEGVGSNWVGSAERYAYGAACLFKSEDRLLRYLKRWGSYGPQPLHDVIQNIKIPQRGELDLKAWGDAVMAQGPKMARLVQFSDKLTQPMKDASDKGWSYNNTKAEVAKYRYKNGEKSPVLAKYCFDFSWPEQYFDKGLELIEEYSEKYAANDNKKGGAIPEITIEGKAFDKEGYHFRRLDDGDVKGLLLGEFTDCCQHLGNEGSSCAKHGFLSENGGFYVVEAKKTGKIVAQSWAWRGDKGELVFDSLESLSGHFNAQQWTALCTEFSLKLKEHAQALSIPSFHIGTCGATPRDLAFAADFPAKPLDYEGYRDSTLQYLVASY